MADQTYPLAHFVTRNDWGSGYVSGQVVNALCGAELQPSATPDADQLCPACQHLMASQGGECSDLRLYAPEPSAL